MSTYNLDHLVHRITQPRFTWLLMLTFNLVHSVHCTTQPSYLFLLIQVLISTLFYVYLITLITTDHPSILSAPQEHPSIPSFSCTFIFLAFLWWWIKLSMTHSHSDSVLPVRNNMWVKIEGCLGSACLVLQAHLLPSCHPFFGCMLCRDGPFSVVEEISDEIQT